MSAIRIAGFAAASILVGAIGFAQNASKQTSSDKHIAKADMTTVVGCLMKETDYRAAHGFGKGTIGGAGLGDEYVIVNAAIAPTPSASSAGASPASSSSRGATSATCAENGGMAYRTTGHRERDLKPFLGQQVAVTGHFQHAATASETTVPQGKLPPEIVVASFGPAPAPAAPQEAANVAEPPASTPAPAIEPAPQSAAPVGTSGNLPKTAGDEPLIGLIGLLSLGAAFSLKLLRRVAA